MIKKKSKKQKEYISTYQHATCPATHLHIIISFSSLTDGKRKVQNKLGDLLRKFYLAMEMNVWNDCAYKFIFFFCCRCFCCFKFFNFSDNGMQNENKIIKLN